MSFNTLGLSPSILKAIEEKGYTTPSPIQEKAIPVILDRKDILASAQTGTGKTAGFTLPILQILSQNPPAGRRKIRALVLTPTRELAAQILENVREYSTYLDIRSTVIFGGVNQNPQVATLKNGIDILIATPGRLLDLHQQRLLNIGSVEILVLDEADRMLDMGFAKDINRIMAILPERRQNLLFSATFSLEIKKMAAGILFDPELVEATPENTTAEKVIHNVIRVDKGMKNDLIVKLIDEGDWQQVLIFTRTKHGANKLSEKLEKSGMSSAAIHGNKTQNARTKALDGFKKGQIRVLVATDIAARGLDIPLLPHVVNYELPNVPEDYVHRIGRTGRAGASGEAVSLVCAEEIDYLRGIEKLLDLQLPVEIVSGFEPLEVDRQPPPKMGGGQRPPRSNDNRGGGGKPRPSGGGGNRPAAAKGNRPFNKNRDTKR
ncbi:DEAD/DEAH box helicase [Lacihabitans lacunae]|uniref:DEAD/DEAH box helicase n=1 Tax=Lacihabitans lacunae TaxID=1028214 RepID=A0ABV7YV37_9BACT